MVLLPALPLWCLVATQNLLFCPPLQLEGSAAVPPLKGSGKLCAGGFPYLARIRTPESPSLRLLSYAESGLVQCALCGTGPELSSLLS
jgi:hypothetical protein